MALCESEIVCVCVCFWPTCFRLAVFTGLPVFAKIIPKLKDVFPIPPLKKNEIKKMK